MFPKVVARLKEVGHSVYDFRVDGGYKDPAAWSNWTPAEYKKFLLNDPAAAQGFLRDFRSMVWADTFVLVLPAGRSAHLEIGWGSAAGKRTIVLLPEKQKFRPELMLLVAGEFAVSLDELVELLK